MFSRLPLRYKVQILFTVFLGILLLLSLAYTLLFYHGPYEKYLSSALSFGSSYVLYLYKRFSERALAAYKKLKLDVRRFDRHDMAEFRKRYGAVTECFGIEVPEVEEIDGKLRDASKVKCSFVDSTYIPRDLIEMVEPFREDLKAMAKEDGIATRYYMKARVRSWGDEIVMERVPYLYSYVFHFSPGIRIGKKRLRDIIRPLVYDSGIVPLESSRLPNHLGVRCIATTKDGYFVISKRGAELAIGKFMYSISCEGAVSAPRGEGESTLKELIHQQVEHELNLDMDEYEAFVLSFSRDMAMMGKPNVYVRLRLKLTKDELKERLRNVGEDLKFEFTRDPKRYLKKATHTLIYGLRLRENRVKITY